MVVVIVKVNCKPIFVFFLIVVLFVGYMLVLSFNSLHQIIRQINRPSPKKRMQCEEDSAIFDDEKDTGCAAAS